MRILFFLFEIKNLDILMTMTIEGYNVFYVCILLLKQIIISLWH